MVSTKSIFISLYFIVLAISLFLFGYTMVYGELDEIYFFAAFLSSLGPILYFLFLYSKKPKDVSFLGILIFTFSGVCALIATGYYFTEGSEYKFPMISAQINFVFWIVYHVWYNKFKMLPEQELKDKITNSSQISALIQTKPNRNKLILFINNTLYPFSVRQYIDFVISETKFTELETDVYYISSDPKYKSIQYKSNNDVLDNSDGRYTESLSVHHLNSTPFSLGRKIAKSYSTPPIGVVFDKSDKIRFIHQSNDARKRPDPAFFLRILKEF